MAREDRTDQRWRRLGFGALALLAPLAALFSAGGDRAYGGLGDPLAPPAPNIVVVMTDDQPASTVTPEAMPNLHELLIGPGTSFSDYIVTTPLCCPSRASLLTGQYGHNNGVLRNNYADLIDKDSVLPVWLQEAGYNTAHVGKYLNGFGAFSGSQKDIAPGWDLWFTLFEHKRYYGWKASKNGKVATYGNEDSDQLTDVINRRAGRWAGKLVRKPEPFYLQVDQYAPHGAGGRDRSCLLGPSPSPRDAGAFATVPLPTPPSFNEAGRLRQALVHRR